MKKVELGQFFTRKDWWLKDKPQILNFLNTLDKEILIDPFAGEGDIIGTCEKIISFKEVIKYDIEHFDDCVLNDSLVSMPYDKNGFFVTNPPYLAKNSAKRKKIYQKVQKYFESSNWSDLYQIALEKMILTNMPGAAIVPESFLNSKFLKKYQSKIDLITVIIPNPFEDTEIPICVVCFNGKTNKTLIYINNELINDLKLIKNKKMIPNHSISITFNNKLGQIGLRAIDLKEKRIQFMPAKYLKYNMNYIKHSSRAITFIKIDLKTSIDEFKYVEEICNNANNILENFRKETSSLLLTPFKGNDSADNRRRRLDYRTARAILEKAINNVSNF